MRLKQKLYWLSLPLLILLQVCLPPMLYAQSSSSHYYVNEVQFGSGGDNTTSTNYQAQNTLGGLSGDNASSTNYQSKTGYLTQNAEYLEVGIISGTVALGTLSSAATMSGTGSFYVRAYTGSGYVVSSISQPPKISQGYTLKNKASLAAPIIGTEEFGMNVVFNANYCGAGCNLGADPAPQPNSSFANGVAATGYSTPNQFKYVPGDIIASAPSGNGQTNFTISYIANISGVTPAGAYVMSQNLVVTTSY